MKKSPLARFFNMAFDLAPYLILAATLMVTWFAIDLSRTAEEFLSSNYLHHQRTRNIIKTNLLTQRGFSQTVLALQSGNEDQFYDAIDLLEGALTFHHSRPAPTSGEEEIPLLIGSLIGTLEQLGDERFATAHTLDWSRVAPLQQQAARLFSLLAAEDNKNWIDTTADSAQRQAHLTNLHTFFIFLCFSLGLAALLIAVAIRHRRGAERALQELTSELESRVEARTDELTQANDELAQQSALTQTILNTIPAPVFYKDAAGIYVGGNKAFEAYLGIPLEKIVGSTVHDIAPKELADVYHRADLELIEKGGTQVYEASVRYADGSLHDVIFHKAVFSDENGTAEGQVGVILDISERKQIEEALRRSEQKFHGIFDQSLSLIGLLSPDGTLLETNKTSLAMIDADPGDVLGKPFWETPWWSYDTDAQKQIKDAIARAATGEVVRFEATHPDIHGQRVTVDCSLKPITNERGEVLFIIPEGRDITELKRHEQLLLSIARGITADTGEEFFYSLAATMNHTLGSDYAIISKALPTGQDQYETVAYNANGKILRNFSYSIEGSPCQGLFSTQDRCVVYPQGVADSFPEYKKLKEMEAEAYIGVPLFSSAGKPIGLLAALFRVPLQETTTAENLLHIFAARAAGELERQTNEHILKEREESFHTIFQTSPEAVVVARLSDYKIIDCNAGMSTITGYSREEILGKTSLEVGIWNDPADRQHMYDLLQREGKVDNLEFAYHLKDGSVGDGLLSVRIIQIHGEPHLLVVTRDISGIKQAQSALAESEKRYRELYDQFQVLLDGIPDALLLCSRDLEIVWANKGAANHFGAPLEELAGKTCHELWGETSNACEEYFRDIFEEGTPYETMRNTGDGRRWGIKIFPIFDHEGYVINAIQIASDITEKTRLREQTTQSSRLASLGELAAGVAHEINNPNAQILLNLPLVAEAIIDSLPILDQHLETDGDFPWGGLRYSRMRQEVPQLVEEMQDAAGRIKHIVEDLKNFTRQDTSDYTQPLDLNATLETAVRLAGSTIKASTDRFDVSYGENLPPIRGIRQRIEQVMLNLILNACQALPVRKRGIFVHTLFDSEKGMVFAEIRDEGVGMTKEVLDHITDPFFTTRREVGGTGLGLSISTRIIKEYGGDISFASQPEKGTTVRVSLPAQQLKDDTHG